MTSSPSASRGYALGRPTTVADKSLVWRHTRKRRKQADSEASPPETTMGFFEHADFLNLIRNLPSPIDDAAGFAYICGWRAGEISA